MAAYYNNIQPLIKPHCDPQVIRAGTPEFMSKLIIINRLFKMANPNSNDLVTVFVFGLSLKMPLLDWN